MLAKGADKGHRILVVKLCEKSVAVEIAGVVCDAKRQAILPSQIFKRLRLAFTGDEAQHPRSKGVVRCRQLHIAGEACAIFGRVRPDFSRDRIETKRVLAFHHVGERDPQPK